MLVLIIITMSISVGALVALRSPYTVKETHHVPLEVVQGWNSTTLSYHQPVDRSETGPVQQ
jgi:hypothetical protein